MLNKYYLFSLSLLTLSGYGMDKNELQPWVKDAKKINIFTLVGKDIPVLIDDGTTVSQVKRVSLESEGIPVEKQAHYPLTRSWFSKTTETKLTDDQNIKQIMNANSDRFSLAISLREASITTEINEQ
jgi:hypothetical protein